MPVTTIRSSPCLLQVVPTPPFQPVSSSILSESTGSGGYRGPRIHDLATLAEGEAAGQICNTPPLHNRTVDLQEWDRTNMREQEEKSRKIITENNQVEFRVIG